MCARLPRAAPAEEQQDAPYRGTPTLRGIACASADALASTARTYRATRSREETPVARRVLLPAILFSLFAAPAVLHGVGWTAGASTGIIDDGDLNKVSLNNDGSATIRSSINSTSAKLRFNITAVDGVEPVDESSRVPAFAIAFRDNGLALT
jgi:hypothetical protein